MRRGERRIRAIRVRSAARTGKGDVYCPACDNLLHSIPYRDANGDERELEGDYTLIEATPRSRARIEATFHNADADLVPQDCVLAALCAKRSDIHPKDWELLQAYNRYAPKCAVLVFIKRQDAA